MAALKLPVFWSSRKLTSLRGPGASALPPLTIFHSLSALQRWQNCAQIRHRLQQRRLYFIPAQHRRAAVTRPPRFLRPFAVNKCSSSSCRRCGLAITAVACPSPRRARRGELSIGRHCNAQVENSKHGAARRKSAMRFTHSRKLVQDIKAPMPPSPLLACLRIFLPNWT
jgi:hypothetical protein